MRRGKPKTKIAEQNYYAFDTYFHENYTTTINNRNLYKPDKYYEASKELINVRQASKEVKDYSVRASMLQAWADKYLSAQDWDRCLKAIRQARHRKKKRIVSLQFPFDEYYTLKFYAKKVAQPIWKAVHELVHKEYERLCDEEMEKKLDEEMHKVRKD